MRKIRKKRAKGGAIAPVRYTELLASNLFGVGAWAPIFILGAPGPLRGPPLAPPPSGVGARGRMNNGTAAGGAACSREFRRRQWGVC